MLRSSIRSLSLKRVYSFTASAAIRSRVAVPYKRHYSVANVTIPATHKRSFGQPTYITHPNLMKKGQGNLYIK